MHFEPSLSLGASLPLSVLSTTVRSSNELVVVGSLEAPTYFHNVHRTSLEVPNARPFVNMAEPSPDATVTMTDAPAIKAEESLASRKSYRLVTSLLD